MPTYDDVTPGQRLPDLEIPITRRLIVSGAIASRDYENIHHDTAAAQDRGLKDVIMNVYTSEGLVSRYVTDWAGPDAVLKRITLKLGVSNYPGDTMRLQGRVLARTGGSVEVEVTGTNSLGEHVGATVTVVLGRDGTRA